MAKKPTAPSSIKVLADGSIGITIKPGQEGPKRISSHLMFRLADLSDGTYLVPHTAYWKLYRRQHKTRDGFVYASADGLLAMLIAHAELAAESKAAGSPDPEAVVWPFPEECELIAYEATVRGMGHLPKEAPKSRAEILQLVKDISGCQTLEISLVVERRVKKYLAMLRKLRAFRESIITGARQAKGIRCVGRKRTKDGVEQIIQKKEH